MRSFWLAIVALLSGLVSALGQDSPDQDRSIGEMLPLFAQNHCEQRREAANQLFCGDSELNAIGTKLASAVEARLNRLPDRLVAVEENAEWARDRNLSCGIFPGEAVRFADIAPIKACLLKETEERIVILRDPNFDCLASNTAAGALICSDPALAIAEGELNDRVLALIARLNDSDAKNAFVEYARWIRERDRKCDLAGKENVPLEELEAAAGCLASGLASLATEVAAAGDEPGKLFGHRALALRPNADAVDICVAQIHLANACGDFLRVRQVREIGSDVTDKSANVTAEVEMVVLAPFTECSPVAASCTGTCWDARAGRPKPPPGTRNSFVVAHRIRIERAFALQKGDDGSWRCNAMALAPVDAGIAAGGP
ncbi:lysozyme inhibitor LprI family protein [Bradyrhizobium sp. Tv2a-2]|uniref:lysozyme inhibitor LprI family protein n=1 Tax=Bradyrhizobium sp. Tv2a-2 TaxID=113395 RepID=UPI0004635D03|nr:lysozyme inhibitor LprI family protein [Bradyrhizobium sp. Tv2a-2]